MGQSKMHTEREDETGCLSGFVFAFYAQLSKNLTCNARKDIVLCTKTNEEKKKCLTDRRMILSFSRFFTKLRELNGVYWIQTAFSIEKLRKSEQLQSAFAAVSGSTNGNVSFSRGDGWTSRGALRMICACEYRAQINFVFVLLQRVFFLWKHLA